nr:hypothetical protein [Tanacetum cinerariifolium]
KILEALTVDGMRKKSITRFRACLMKWTKPGAGARAGAKILEALTVDELQKKSITRFRACLTKWAELGAGAEARAEAGAGAGAQLRLGLGLSPALRKKLLATKNEAIKEENAPAEILRGLDQQMEIGEMEICDQGRDAPAEILRGLDQQMEIGEMEAEVEENRCLEMVQETTDKVVLIKKRLKAARDR